MWLMVQLHARRQHGCGQQDGGDGNERWERVGDGVAGEAEAVSLGVNAAAASIDVERACFFLVHHGHARRRCKQLNVRGAGVTHMARGVWGSVDSVERRGR